MNSLQNLIEEIPREFPEIQQGHFYPSLDSTNLEAQRLAEARPDLSALLVAEGQSAGRGRKGRSWESPKGKGLYFSLLLRPKLKTPEGTLITLAAGLSLGRTLRKLGLAPILIKWPNDILLQGKKVAGILCEMKSTENIVSDVVVGVGINISQKPADFSPEVRERAGSLEELTQKKWDKEEILKSFLRFFLPEIKNLEEGKKEDLISRWEKESDLLGRNLLANLEYERQIGTVLGLTPQGYLRLKMEDGSELQLIDEETILL